jgi:hypothetical protein
VSELDKAENVMRRLEEYARGDIYTLREELGM